MFSRTTTELSIRRESASASPPSTMELIDEPPNCRMKKVAQMESGMEKKTAVVARRLPRKTRIMRQVRNRPMAPFRAAAFRWARRTEARLDRKPHRSAWPGYIHQMADHLAHAVYDGDRIGIAALLHDGEIHRALPVHADHVVLQAHGHR